MFLLTQDLSSPSGLGRYWPLARELVCLGHDVSISALHPNYQSIDKKKIIRDGVVIEYVAPMHVKKIGNDKSYYSPQELLWVVIKSTWQLTKAALRFNGQVIHIGKPHPMNGIAGILAGLLKRRILFLDCDDDEVGSNRLSNKWQYWGLSIFERFLPSIAYLVTINSCTSIERMKKWGISEKKLIYLPNGVDRSRFSEGDHFNVEELRNKLNLDQKPVVAYIGSLSLPSHPVNLLVDAFANVKNRIPNAVLLIIGGGEDLQRLQEQAQALELGDSVLFLGRISPEEVISYYKLATVTVDPVNDDAASKGRVPLKMFESWASGTPMITASVGDRERIAGNPSAAYLIQAGNSQILADAIVYLLSNQEVCQQLIKRGFDRVEQYYWDQITERIQWIYNLEKKERK